jgi:hypothetical protein
MNPVHFRFGRHGMWLLFAGLFLSAGCGGGPAKVDVYPVRGECFVGDQPAQGALIVLHPAEGAASSAAHAHPHAVVEADGSFQISTYEAGDGAPPGKYVAVVTWPQLNAADESSEVETPTDSEGLPLADDRLNGRYADPAKSILHVNIEAQPNQLSRFHLQ